MRLASTLLWLATAALVAALALRFAMRASGVRDDIPFPWLVYSLTAPLVDPLYRYFPASGRFDLKAVEVASLAAAGLVILAALALYIIGLMTGQTPRSKSGVESRKSKKPTFTL